MSLVCGSCAIDCKYGVQELFFTPDVASKPVPDMKSSIQCWDKYDAMSCIVFDATSGVKKLATFLPAIKCPISAIEPSCNLISTP